MRSQGTVGPPNRPSSAHHCSSAMTPSHAFAVLALALAFVALARAISTAGFLNLTTISNVSPAHTGSDLFPIFNYANLSILGGPLSLDSPEAAFSR